MEGGDLVAADPAPPVEPSVRQPRAGVLVPRPLGILVTSPRDFRARVQGHMIDARLRLPCKLAHSGELIDQLQTHSKVFPPCAGPRPLPDTSYRRPPSSRTALHDADISQFRLPTHPTESRRPPASSVACKPCHSRPELALGTSINVALPIGPLYCSDVLKKLCLPSLATSWQLWTTSPLPCAKRSLDLQTHTCFPAHQLDN